MTQADSAVVATGLTKRFGDFTAVDDICLDVAAGEIFGFLGANGSGKTTTIRMLTGSVPPSSGRIHILGTDVVTHPARIRPRIGYMSQRFSLYEDLTVHENLRFFGGVYGLDPATFARRREYVMDMARLEGHEDVLTKELSVGWRQRLALGVATLHEPELLFLDEPTSGVDPVMRRQFWDLINDLAVHGVTVFVTTHYMEEASNCSTLAFMDQGRIIAAGTPRHIRHQVAQPDEPLPSLEETFLRLLGRGRGQP